MSTLRSFLLESHMPEHFTRAVYAVLPLVEATNINKQFLLKEAGSPDALKEARGRVAAAWESAQMGDILRGNLLQKLLNFLCLMEIRKPGFVDTEVLHSIHDLALHNSLEQRFLSKVSSDTTPEQATEALKSAAEGAARAAKVYPDLTEEEEKVWNRVKVYHEFPDGFRWVYAVDDEGNVVGYMPASITGKTMNHCGNQPSNQTGNEYWELRGPDGKAYLTVILDAEGRIEESKSWGNQVNKHRKMIMPYVKWFLKDQKVTGVGWRYDNGYATHRNFGVKDFIGDDPEFVDYVTGNKPELIGNAESRILFWKGALDEGVVTVADLKRMFDGNERMSELRDRMPALDEYCGRARFIFRADRDEGGNDPSPFGLNRFAVLCATCGGNPFSEKETERLIAEKKISLEEFANYDIKLLTPEIQRAFVGASDRNINVLQRIAEHVAAFRLDDELWLGMMPTDGDSYHDCVSKTDRLLDFVAGMRPPEKADGMVEKLFGNAEFVDRVAEYISRIGDPSLEESDDVKEVFPISIFSSAMKILSEHPGVGMPAKFVDAADGPIGRIRDAAVPAGSWSNPWTIMFLNALLKAGTLADSIVAKIDATCVAGAMKKVARGKYETQLTMFDLLTKLVGPDMIEAAARTSATAASMLPYLACMPVSDERADAAREAVRNAVAGYKEGEWPGAKREDMRPAFDVAYRYPDSLDGVTGLPNAWNAIYAMLASCDYAQGDKHWNLYTADGMRDLLDRICSMVSDRPTDEMLLELWGGNRMGEQIELLARKYSLTGDEVIRHAFRVMFESLMESSGPRFTTPGLISGLLDIPFDEWEAEYGEHGADFIEAYVLRLPNKRFEESGFPAEFVGGKLVGGMGRHDAVWVLGGLGGDNRRKKTLIGAWISRSIVSGGIQDIPDYMAKLLEDGRLINADAMRCMIQRSREKGEALSVDSFGDAERVLSRFPSLAKLPDFPVMVKSSLMYCLDRIYESLGDGRVRWKADECCRSEANLVAMLCTRLKRSASNGNVAEAILGLDCPEVAGRIAGFDSANRAACDEPGKPRSKFKCEVAATLAIAKEALDEATAVVQHKRPSGKRSARKATA